MFMFDLKQKQKEEENNIFCLTEFITEKELFLYLLKQLKDYYYFTSEDYKRWKSDFDYHFQKEQI